MCNRRRTHTGFIRESRPLEALNKRADKAARNTQTRERTRKDLSESPINLIRFNDQDQQRYKKEHQQKTKELQRLEQDLEKLLAEKSSLEAKMSDSNVYANQEAYKQLDADYQAITNKIGPMQTKQDQLVELLMELEEKIS